MKKQLRMMAGVGLALAALAGVPRAYGEGVIGMAPVFTDHAVLQRDKAIASRV